MEPLIIEQLMAFQGTGRQGSPDQLANSSLALISIRSSFLTVSITSTEDAIDEHIEHSLSNHDRRVRLEEMKEDGIVAVGIVEVARPEQQPLRVLQCCL